MMKLVSQQKILLKANPDINEKMIQDYIFENPTILGLGDLQPIIKEKSQPSGGRLDMLFADEDSNRYEVELQLGSTDPSHIIRTLEYWDTEKKRYPQYDHTAVIIAEDITSRFQNVISLFNNQIPLIALQLSATKTESGDISISFVKVMDKVELGSDEEDYAEATDRAYWEKKSNKKILHLTDTLFDALGERKEGYDLKYNKFYIGLSKDGLAKNFVSFVPKKSFVNMRVLSGEVPEVQERLEQEGVDISYNKRYSRYHLKFASFEEFDRNKDDIIKLVDIAKGRFSLE